MKLYKDYKRELELKRKEEEDRKNLGIPSEVTIIYEPTKFMIAMRRAGSILLLILLLIAICAGVIALTYYFNT